MPRFFHTQYECGVESIQLTMVETNETIEGPSPRDLKFECFQTSFIFRYKNGFIVILTGHLTVKLTASTDDELKIDHWAFDANKPQQFVEHSLIVDQPPPKNKRGGKQASNRSIPQSPVNEWGIPQRFDHFLQVGVLHLCPIANYSPVHSIAG